MEYLKVEGHSNLIRDTKSHAIVNNNMSEYNTFMKTVQEKRKEKDEMRDAIRQINILKNEMYEIKSLLLKLSDKN
jgi:hypothetical protein